MPSSLIALPNTPDEDEPSDVMPIAQASGSSVPALRAPTAMGRFGKLPIELMAMILRILHLCCAIYIDMDDSEKLRYVCVSFECACSVWKLGASLEHISLLARAKYYKPSSPWSVYETHRLNPARYLYDRSRLHCLHEPCGHRGFLALCSLARTSHRLRNATLPFQYGSAGRGGLDITFITPLAFGIFVTKLTNGARRMFTALKIFNICSQPWKGAIMRRLNHVALLRNLNTITLRLDEPGIPEMSGKVLRKVLNGLTFHGLQVANSRPVADILAEAKAGEGHYPVL
ncbi:MAG: hypothetical protein LQ340_001441 [Diploschistes diacapsis]|nr:MAG: hypothetical protein LQ340_001441 [Diploschistes diacapsis]